MNLSWCLKTFVFSLSFECISNEGNKNSEIHEKVKSRFKMATENAENACLQQMCIYVLIQIVNQ